MFSWLLAKSDFVEKHKMCSRKSDQNGNVTWATTRCAIMSAQVLLTRCISILTHSLVYANTHIFSKKKENNSKPIRLENSFKLKTAFDFKRFVFDGGVVVVCNFVSAHRVQWNLLQQKWMQRNNNTLNKSVYILAAGGAIKRKGKSSSSSSSMRNAKNQIHINTENGATQATHTCWL